MAGSPGAGKTEASIELLAILEEKGAEIFDMDLFEAFAAMKMAEFNG